MTELTTRESLVRVAVCERDKCIILNRPDALVVLCFCGGLKAVMPHVQSGEASIPLLRACQCNKEPIEFSTHEDKMWTSGGKVERLYAHLKQRESHPDE